jgi:Raf kinase inhibitor-like YbhB/YbcL family protein
MKKGSLFALAAVCGLSLAWTSLNAAQAPFTVTSSSFTDGGMLTVRNAADDPVRMCGGQNISPALAWANPPANTKSYVVFLDDPEGLLGAGVSHWVAYNIPASVTSFAEGEMAKQSEKFVGGKGTRDNALYIGPCPPTGDAPHHYVFTVIATDLDPGALKAGMAKDEVMAAIKGRMLKAGSLIGRYAR